MVGVSRVVVGRVGVVRVGRVSLVPGGAGRDA